MPQPTADKILMRKIKKSQKKKLKIVKDKEEHKSDSVSGELCVAYVVIWLRSDVKNDSAVEEQKASVGLICKASLFLMFRGRK